MLSPSCISDLLLEVAAHTFLIRLGCLILNRESEKGIVPSAYFPNPSRLPDVETNRESEKGMVPSAYFPHPSRLRNADMNRESEKEMEEF